MTETIQTASTPTRAPRPTGPLLIGGSWWLTGTLAAIGVVVVAYLVTAEGFFTGPNLKAILLASAVVGIVALGQTLIMISGSFVSLSLGTGVAVSAMTFLRGLDKGLPEAMLLALAVGVLVSGVQGWIISAWSANPVIITIGAAAVVQAVAIKITEGNTISPAVGAPSTRFLVDPVLGVSFPFWAMVGLVLVMHLYLSRTRLGALTYLVGENQLAARAAGLPTTLVVTVAFCLAGACGAAAGILIGAQQASASLSVEGTLVFDAIAATLLAGTAVTGGHGSALRTLFGALAIAAISSALLLHGYSTGIQLTARGVILLGSVVLLHLLGRSPLRRRTPS